MALLLNGSVLLVAQSITRDVIKYNFEASTFDTIAGVNYDPNVSADRTEFNLGEMYPEDVPMEMPTINLSEGTNFTEPLVAKDRYSMANFPVSTTIKIFKTTADGIRDQCTGTMVGPRHVLTSAHCAIKPYTVDIVVDKLVVAAAYDVSMDTTEHIMASVSDLYFIDDWNIGQGDDQALLELDEPIGYYTGWVSFGYNDDDEYFADKNFHKFSYPTYRTPYNRFPFNGDTLYYSYGAIDYVAEDFLGVVGHIKGAGGESGSSILYTNNKDDYTSYGVLTWVGYYNHSRFNAERFSAFEQIIGKSIISNTESILDESEVILFPNPSKDYVNIKINTTSIKLKSISLHDNNGRLLGVFGTNNNRAQIDITMLADGLYHIKMLTTDGLKATKSFVKSK